MVPRRRGLRRLPGVAALAGRVCLPAVPDAWPMAAERRSLLVRTLPAPRVGDQWDDLPPYPDAPDGLVRGGLVRDLCEEWRLGHDPAPPLRLRVLPDGVDAAAPLPRGDGAPRSRPARRDGRGRRGLRRWGQAWETGTRGGREDARGGRRGTAPPDGLRPVPPARDREYGGPDAAGVPARQRRARRGDRDRRVARGTRRRPRRTTSTIPSGWPAPASPPTRSCLGCIALRACSSGGCWGPIKGR